jgi:hypothetical protein
MKGYKFDYLVILIYSMKTMEIDRELPVITVLLLIFSLISAVRGTLDSVSYFFPQISEY